MTRTIVRVMTEEDRALAAVLLGIEARRRRAAGLQADLARLTLALDRFAAECHLRLASIFAELDHLKRSIFRTERRIMRLRGQERPPSRPRPDDEAGDEDPPDARFRRRRLGREAPPSEADAEDAAERRRLYLELARRYHPDLATDEDRARCEEMMLRVNAAFRERDLETLRRIANEAESADGPPLHSTAARLRWARREADRLDGLIADLRAELANLRQSESGRFWRRREAGEPIFEVMADELRGEVARQQLRLNDLTTLHDRLARASRTAKRKTARTA